MDTVHEEWRPIAGYEGVYAVSDLGRVRRLGRPAVKGYQPPGRYRTVGLGRGDRRYVHRLVAEAFLTGAGEVVRHLNHDKSDNRAANLAWGSQADNISDNVRAGRHAFGEGNGTSKLTEAQARAIADDTRPEAEIAQSYGVCRGTVNLIRRGRMWRRATGGVQCDSRPRGSRHHQTRLTEADVRAIRADPRPMRVVAADYGVSKATIHRIVRRIYWQHVG